ncbi:MAG TPA: nuclear transport factor 2 family protein [Stellaceae bacterium]|nr:nuclear transport factor 2 family protein [Stellaceae bacterium]
MPEIDDLIDRYIAAWNETDEARRRDLVARTFAPEAHYIDPMMQATGLAEIAAMIRAVQQRFPDHRFRRIGKSDAHNDRARFSWELASEGGPVLAGGTDFAVVADGRFRAVTGFLDRLPATQP